MLLAIDAHAHFYPFYDFAVWHRKAVFNLSRFLEEQAPANSLAVVLLTERADCHFFRELTSPDRYYREFGCSIERTSDGAALIKKLGYPDLLVIPGRQIVTKERIEILALATESDFSEGQDADLVLSEIKDSGGIACLSWSPFKWSFARGRLVEKIIDNRRPGEIVVGDTSLRSRFTPLPKLLQRAQARGFSLLAGSDPLPFRGEELVVGRYGVLLDGEFDMLTPLNSIRKLISNPETSFVIAGDRSNPCSVIRRLLINQMARAK